MTTKSLKFLLVLRILLLSLIGSLFPVIPSFAVPGDEHWDAQFGAPGTTNSIEAIAVNNGMLYVGGYGVPNTNATLCVWDGNQWSAFATFNNGASPASIYDATFVGNVLYVAGIFSSVNGTAANGLARWDGTTWSSIGFGGSGLALAGSGGDLYVGGIFTNLDGSGVMMTNIGLWDGSMWHALGGGLGGPGYLSYVQTIVVNGGSVYAGGSFTNSGTQAITNLAVWNGSIWSAVGGGVNGIVYGLTVNGGSLYAGGGFTQAGSTAANYIAEWDGSNWYALGMGLNGVVDNIAIFNNQVCAVGSFTTAGGIVATNFAVWNGSSWSAAGNGLSASGLRVISNGTNVYVGGTFAVAGNSFVNGVASWDGTNWSGIGTPGRINGLQSTTYAVANDGTNLYAGGIFTFAGQTNANYVARFDGTNWHPLGSSIDPNGSTTIVRALALSSNNVYVGGSFGTAGGVAVPNLGRWDGTNWYSLGGGPGGVVASITVWTDGVYVAGAPQSDANLLYGSPFFERWDGTNWLNMISINATDTISSFYFNDPNIGMDAVVFLNTNIYIGGHFNIGWHDPTFTFVTNCYNIMRFDGSYDRIVGTGLNSNVVAMTVLATNLYAAGLFTNAGGVAASHIAMWDGNNWYAVGSGVVGSGTVTSLATIGNNLYAGGTFTNIGGVAAARVAKWDGTNWFALGSGVVFQATSGSVLGMASVGSDLYVGGGFHYAGEFESYYVGHWNDQINFDTPQLTGLVWLGNGQFRMKLDGISGLTNIVQATTNFSSWVPVLTNMAGIYNFTDPSASNYPYRFYRATLAP